MDECEYLVGYGVAGEFGRFRSNRGLKYARGDRVVVRTYRGVEAGQVLRLAEAGHARFLPNTTVGQLLRPFGSADARTETALRDRDSTIWTRAARLAEEIGLPLEILDVEVLLDGEHVVLHYLRDNEFDARPFVSTLSREFNLHVLLSDLTRNGGTAADQGEPAGHSCGDCCGSEGGCGTCGAGGCGSCTATRQPGAAYFASLRERIEQQRTSLL